MKRRHYGLEKICHFIIHKRDNYYEAIYGTYPNAGLVAFGGPENEGGISGLDVSAVIQAANNALASGGTIYLKEIQLPGTVTLSNTVIVFENYQGESKIYSNLAKVRMLPQLALDPDVSGWGAAEAGREWFNTTTRQGILWDGASKRVYIPSGGGITDHGLLTGLGDDDHVQYGLADGTRQLDKVVITDGTGHYLQVSKLTTTQRDALSPVNGMIIYNSTNTKFERYQNGAWGGFGEGIYKLSPSYTIYKMGTTYYAMDEDGNIDYSGTDASTVIQATINALGANGGIIFFKTGTYVINSQIKLKSDQTLQGEGVKTIFSLNYLVAAYAGMLTNEHSRETEYIDENIEIRGIKFLGLQTLYAQSRGIDLRGVRCVLIENCYFENWGNGIRTDGEVYGEVRYVTIRNCYGSWMKNASFHFYKTHDSIMTNCYATYGDSGIGFTDGYNCIMEGCVIWNNTNNASFNNFTGIVVEGESKNCAVVNCVSFGQKIGIYCSSSVVGISIVGNICFDNSYAGISVIHNAAVVGNFVRVSAGSDRWGITIYNSNIVSGNLILLDGGGNLIGIKAAGVNSSINNNIIKGIAGTDKQGIRVTETSSDVLITNNQFENLDEGVRFATDSTIDRTEIRGNIFDTINSYAIRFLTSGVSNTRIRLNSFYNCAVQGSGIDLNIGYVTENSGTATFSGDGSTTTFSFAHGLAAAPTHVGLEAKTADAVGDKYWSANASNITVTFITAPPTGTNNVILSWEAKV